MLKDQSMGYRPPYPGPAQGQFHSAVDAPFPPSGGQVSDMAGDDYYRGFYQGIMGQRGVQVGSVLSWLGPLVVNALLCVAPLWYLRAKYAGELGRASGGRGPSAWAGALSPVPRRSHKVAAGGAKFADVVGVDAAKAELAQCVDFLRNPAQFRRLGAKMPRGCLLTGGPGTGKTLLAKAVAGEAGCHFFSCSGADFIEIYGGSGPKRVRELFSEAKEWARSEDEASIIFIDELDAIGSRGGNGPKMGAGSSEEGRTINQLLSEMDGMSTSSNVMVIAATNFVENIDKALLREGRFDRKIHVPMPDRTARQELFVHYLNKIVTGDKNTARIQKFSISPKPDTNADKNESHVEYLDPVVKEGVSNKAYANELADRTPGVSPAQISTIVNEAALEAAISDKEVVPLAYLQESIDNVLIGKKHRQRMSGDSLKRTAYHEAGHTLVSWLMPLQNSVIKVSIIPRGRAGGYTQQKPSESENEANSDPKTNEFFFQQLCMMLGGRVAEKVILHDISTGAIDDLQRATKLVISQIINYGMNDRIGPIAFDANQKNSGRAYKNYSENLHSQVESEAKELMHKAYIKTTEIIENNKDNLHKLALLLLEKKEVNEQEIEAIFGPKITT